MKRFFCFLLSVCLFSGVVVFFNGCKKDESVGCRYEITAEYVPEAATLAAVMKVEYKNRTDDEISELKFNLYPNAYREDAVYRPVSPVYSSSAYYAGTSYGSMEISSVNGGKSWEIAGEDKNILTVTLEESLFPGDGVTLDISFLTKLAKINHRTGVTRNTVNLGNFFPILCGYSQGAFYECVYYSDGDPFFSEQASFSVSFTVPREYTLASTGKIVSEKTLESKKEYTMSATNVRDFAVVLSDCFEMVSSRSDGVEVRYYYYNDEQPAAHLAAAQEALGYYSSTFGKYPYETYSVVQTGFCYGGMEYPSLVMISDALSENNCVYTIVHETAHQWWYAAVGNNQVENAWQDEGLSEYSTALFFEAHPDYGFTREQIISDALEEYRAYYSVYSQVFGEADTRMTRSLKDYLSEYEYRCIAYDKGAILFDMLRGSIGDKKFFSGLKKYYSAYRYKVAAPEDLIGCFERTGVDVAGFFDSFLSGKAVL